MDFCPYCQRFPGDDHVNDDLSKGTKDHINYCFACGRLITNNPIKHGDFVLNLYDDPLHDYHRQQELHSYGHHFL